MDIITLRDFCLSLPHSTEDFPFDETTLAFRVMGKIFAMINIEKPEWFVLKCEPEYSIELRERYADINPAWHMNKRHWNQINLFGTLPDSLIRSLIEHSYTQVVNKLPRKVRESL